MIYLFIHLFAYFIYLQNVLAPGLFSFLFAAFCLQDLARYFLQFYLCFTWKMTRASHPQRCSPSLNFEIELLMCPKGSLVANRFGLLVAPSTDDLANHLQCCLFGHLKLSNVFCPRGFHKALQGNNPMASEDESRYVQHLHRTWMYRMHIWLPSAVFHCTSLSCPLLPCPRPSQNRQHSCASSFGGRSKDPQSGRASHSAMQPNKVRGFSKQNQSLSPYLGAAHWDMLSMRITAQSSSAPGVQLCCRLLLASNDGKQL